MNLFERWAHWSRTSTNRKIFNAALIIGALTFGVKLIALVKEQAVAARFGTGNDLEAFIIAFTVPSFFVSVISGSLNAAFIPTYIRVREKDGDAAAQRFFSGIFFWAIILLSGAAVLILATAPFYIPLLASGFSMEKLELTRKLLLLTVPVVVLAGISTLLGAVLNAGERFALVAATPVITSLAILSALLAGRTFGIFALAVGTISGMALELALLGNTLQRRGISPLPRWQGLDQPTRQVGRQLLPMVSGSLLMSSTVIVDQAMAAMLDAGSVAALSYGSRLVAFPVGLGATALGTAVVPYFSTMAARNDWEGIRLTLSRYVKLLAVITVPATVLIVMFSVPVVQLVYQRGAFTAADTLWVARILSCFALQIPFYITGILFVRLISAMLANRILMYGNIISVTLNISLNYLFMKTMGVAGIALSTSCVYMVSFLFLAFALWRVMPSQNQAPVVSLTPEE